MKHLIAFIDDEPNILLGLKRLLRSKRDVWDMVFLEGGEAAIDWIANNEPDAIVTDMRMPSVDGAKVLEYAASHKKGRIRIVLSGEADRDLTRRTIGRSHQFFSKPCDESKLIRTIETTFSTGDDVLTPEMQRFVSNITTLPGPTRTHDALEEVFRSGTIGDLSRIIAHDPALALRVLQLANSSYFGHRAETLSIASAVRNVGVEVLANLWETGSLLAAPDTKDIDEQLTKLADEAVKTAQRLHEIGLDQGASDADCEDCYAIGLLSWTGEVIGCVGSPALKAVLNDGGALAATAYVTCLLGMPARITHIMEQLADVVDANVTALERAEEIGSIKYRKEKVQ